MEASLRKPELAELIGAIIVTATSWVIYLLTVAPTVSFWDCGEFIAAAYALGVPHPPGAPLYLLLGRIFSLLPVTGDIALRVNLISTIASALAVLLTYLIILRLIREFAGDWHPTKMWPAVFSSAIGALALAFADSFWFNSVEAEVYALSTFFTTAVIYLILVWGEKHEHAAAGKYLLLIAYLLGLAIGVHLLNLLAIPSIVLIIYFRRYAFSWARLLIALAIGGALILAIDPVLIKGLPKLMTLFGSWILPALLIGLGWILWNAARKLQPRLFLSAAAILLVVIGYSTYASIFIRSQLNPRLDENDPENLPQLVSYLNREQYGTESLVSQIFDRKADFWDYQVREMYVRYFGWQFIGRDADLTHQRETFQLEGLWGLPFLIGLVGMWYHFRRDPRRALVVLVVFLMTGFAIIIYLNQALAQPRERDYSYVGSFFAFAIWIGIGAFALMQSALTQRRWRKIYVVAATASLIFAVPVKMVAHNYHTHDRSDNYAAFDYAYNVLQTCAPNAILFTNGDNDTFPLWFLQEVKGFRRDVSVICLSLLNTGWYIRQIRDREPRVPISLKDEQIDSLGLFPWPQERLVQVPINEKAFRRYVETAPKHIPVDSLLKQPRAISILLNPTYQGKFLRTQDIMIFDIIGTNQFKRPIYFGFNVPGSARAGLQNYLRGEGMAYQLMPFVGVAYAPEILHRNLFEIYQYRGLNDPGIYFDDQERGLLRSYRYNFLTLVWFYSNRDQRSEAQRALQKMAEVFPEAVWPSETFEQALNLGEIYWQAGVAEELRRQLDLAPQRFLLTPADQLRRATAYDELLGDRAQAEGIVRELIQQQPGMREAYASLGKLYARAGRVNEAIAVWQEWLRKYPQDEAAQKTVQDLLNRH